MSGAPIDFGRPVVVWRTRRPVLSGRIERRALLVWVVMLLALGALSLATLAMGTYRLSVGEVLSALVGRGEGPAQMLVVEWRLPRLLFAILGGTALALSGAIFQSLTRNPLGSPDIIGFDAGSYTGAVVVMLVIGSGAYSTIALGSLVGGMATAVLVYLLAYRRGVQGFRLIIVGIGVAALLTSLNSYLLLSADAQRARSAATWGYGSLSALGFEQLLPFVIGLAVLLVPLGFIGRKLSQIELGDDAARALGTRVERARLAAMMVGVALTALVTAAAGPIAFVALVAPQIAHRITRSAGIDLVSSALVGAVLLTASDFVGQRIDVAVGLVTVVLGGLYFIWLLTREHRRS